MIYIQEPIPQTRQAWSLSIGLSVPGQNGRHFADDIFKCIFMNEYFSILIRISLKFVPKGPIDNMSVMAWCRTGDNAFTRINADPAYRRIYVVPVERWVTSSRSAQNIRHFADNISDPVPALPDSLADCTRHMGWGTRLQWACHYSGRQGYQGIDTSWSSRLKQEWRPTDLPTKFLVGTNNSCL